ncbi:MAG: GFA family protein [Gammaproteobacteria bacterium]
MASKTRDGGCMCGSVRLTLTGEPISVGLCHCRDCQKQTGSAFSMVALVPTAAVTIQGTMAVVKTIAASGKITQRSFCPQCGSPIVSDTEGTRAHGITILKAGLFDDTSWLKPSVQIFCDNAQAWMPALDLIPGFPRMPPA